MAKNSVYNYYSKWIRDNSKAELYSLFNPGELSMRHSRERVTLSMLAKYGFSDFTGKLLLEVGCGRGHQIGEYLRWGCNPDQITGVDIMPEFVTESSSRFPGTNIIEGSALELPFDTDSFDIVSQSTVLTSLTDDGQRKLMAKEMLRVLKPGGIILWFDFRFRSPKNPNVRHATAAEVKALFQGTEIHLQSVNLLPPLARMIAPVSVSRTSALEVFPFLRSHLRGVFVKK